MVCLLLQCKPQPKPVVFPAGEAGAWHLWVSLELLVFSDMAARHFPAGSPTVTRPRCQRCGHFEGSLILLLLPLYFLSSCVTVFESLWHQELELCIYLIYPEVVIGWVQTWCPRVHATEVVVQSQLYQVPEGFPTPPWLSASHPSNSTALVYFMVPESHILSLCEASNSRCMLLNG